MLGAGVDRPLTGFGLLRTHVRRRADREPPVGEHLGALRITELRNTEIRQHGVAISEQNVSRLDVAVHKAAAVHVVEPRSRLPRQCGATPRRSGVPLREPLPKRPAGNVRDDEIEKPLTLARINQRDNVWVRQFGRNVDLAEEPSASTGGCKRRLKYLDRDPPAMPRIHGQIHDSRAATAQLALNAVAGPGGPGSSPR